MWKYLQLILFSVITNINSEEYFGDTAKLFEAINQDELKDWAKEIFKKNPDRDVAANMSYGLNYLVLIDGKFNKIIEQLLENSIKDKEKEIEQAEKDVVLKDLQEDEIYKRRWVLYFNSLESNLETEKQTLQEWRGKKAKSIEKQEQCFRGNYALPKIVRLYRA